MVSYCIDRLKNGHKTPVAHSLYSNLYMRFQSISRSSIHNVSQNFSIQNGGSTCFYQL